jgi:transposase
MAARRKYPDELRERATRMAIGARKDPGTAGGAIRRIADQLTSSSWHFPESGSVSV